MFYLSIFNVLIELTFEKVFLIGVRLYTNVAMILCCPILLWWFA